jgi:hypothetical protein
MIVSYPPMPRGINGSFIIGRNEMKGESFLFGKVFVFALISF